MGDEPVLGEATGELGQRWETLRNTYKPYPCGIVMHAIIDACLDLRTQGPPGQIAVVTVFGVVLFSYFLQVPMPILTWGGGL